MPSNSRPRSRDIDARLERGAQGRDRERDRRRHRYDREVEEDTEAQEELEDDLVERRHRHRASQTPPRRNRYQERDDDDDDNDLDADGGEVIVVDSRPNRSTPANIYVSPRRGGAPSPGRRKAKESPATSPIKKSDRRRDQEGRTRRDSTADEDSPTKAARLRDRRRRDHNHDRTRERGTPGYSSGGNERHHSRDRERDRRKATERDRNRVKSKHASADSTNSATQLLSADTLAKLNAHYEKDAEKERAYARKEDIRAEKEKKRRRKRHEDHDHEILEEKLQKKHAKRRIVSGALLEEGRSPELRVRGWRGDRGMLKNERWRKGSGGNGGASGDGKGGGFRSWSRKKMIFVIAGVLALLLAIIIPVAIVVARKANNSSGSSPPQPTPSGDLTAGLKNISRNSIPPDARGTYYDPFTWYDTTDFNLTYTDETVGGLPIMGLYSTWDDSAQANENVPPLDKEFNYGKQPIRGVNIGGWLSVEPFITPSFFTYPASDNVVDEYTLTQRLGSTAAGFLEKHYATFINEQSFIEIRDAGFDHVRIPYSYWAVTTYDGDPYVKQTSWRYLLRAIEYCRKYGLRVNVDLHGLPGSQNGWNHSGRQGSIGWLDGPDGDVNGQRSLDIHGQLSTFFAQPRYKNVIAIYGLANEPRMLEIETSKVINWTMNAADIVTKNGMKQLIAFGDGFLRLNIWETILQDTGYNLLIDTHQYTIFNDGEIVLEHAAKLDLVCNSWVPLISGSNNHSAGWGPTICGEWSQADTDCATYLNNVGTGARWTGNLDSSGPLCPDKNSSCDCDPANADPGNYSASYKIFLQAYAEAQISAFEQGYGWFYWTWDTESAVPWSWKKGLAAGILPAKAYAPTFKCGDKYPDFADLPETY